MYCLDFKAQFKVNTDTGVHQGISVPKTFRLLTRDGHGLVVWCNFFPGQADDSQFSTPPSPAGATLLLTKLLCVLLCIYLELYLFWSEPWEVYPHVSMFRMVLLVFNCGKATNFLEQLSNIQEMTKPLCFQLNTSGLDLGMYCIVKNWDF